MHAELETVTKFDHTLGYSLLALVFVILYIWLLVWLAEEFYDDRIIAAGLLVPPFVAGLILVWR